MQNSPLFEQDPTVSLNKAVTAVRLQDSVPELLRSISHNVDFNPCPLELPGCIDTHPTLAAELSIKGVPTCPQLIYMDSRREQRLSEFSNAIQKGFDVGYQRGTFVDLCAPKNAQKIYVVGDLHGRLDNLATILNKEGLWQEVKSGAANLVFLGDYVHPEHRSLLFNMESSYRLMQWVMELKIAAPENVHALLGNHDFLKSNVKKGNVDQAVDYNRHIECSFPFTREGSESAKKYLQEYSKAVCRLPLIACCPGFVMAHAGPVLGTGYLLKDLKEIPVKDVGINEQHPQLHQLTWNRAAIGPNLTGAKVYTNTDVERFVMVCGQPSGILLTGHMIGTIFHAGNYCQDFDNSVWSAGANQYVIQSGLNNPACLLIENGQLSAQHVAKSRGFTPVDPDEI